MEFSDSQLNHSNKLIDKENEQPHPLIVKQSSILDHLRKRDNVVKQPCLSSTTTDQPHPSTMHTRYYKLVKEHLAKNGGCGSVSQDAWVLTCEYFNSVQPHPLITTSDWSDFISH